MVKNGLTLEKVRLPESVRDQQQRLVTLPRLITLSFHFILHLGNGTFQSLVISLL